MHNSTDRQRHHFFAKKNRREKNSTGKNRKFFLKTKIGKNRSPSFFAFEKKNCATEGGVR
jgi:hypothetical protein